MVTALLVLAGRASGDNTAPQAPPAATPRGTQIEIGLFAGLQRYEAGDRVISDRIVGLRAAVFPRDFAGVEFEVDIMPGESEDGSSPRMTSYELQAVGRVRFPHVVVGGVAGAGVHSLAARDSIFRESDSFLHWGATAAAPLGRVSFRLDLRHQIGPWAEGGTSQSFVVSAGLSLRLGD
jgi:hypothetical protein